MKLLILGGHGQAGTSLRPLAEAGGITVEAPSRMEADVRDEQRIVALITGSRPDWVINFSAFHVLEACEDDFASAMAVNAMAVRSMAIAARLVNARFLTVSTDYVFDGGRHAPWHEDDEARPLQAYGVSKRAGELAACAAAPTHSFIVRTCGLYGQSGSRDRGGNFVEKRLREAASKERLEVGSDLVCTPTSADAFATAVLALLLEPRAAPGVYHLTAEGACTWAEFTAEIFALSGIACSVIPIDREGDYGRVRRPANSVLANRRALALGIKLPHWKDDLASYLQRRLRRDH